MMHVWADVAGPRQVDQDRHRDGWNRLRVAPVHHVRQTMKTRCWGSVAYRVLDHRALPVERRSRVPRGQRLLVRMLSVRVVSSSGLAAGGGQWRRGRGRTDWPLAGGGRHRRELPERGRLRL